MAKHEPYTLIAAPANMPTEDALAALNYEPAEDELIVHLRRFNKDKVELIRYVRDVQIPRGFCTTSQVTAVFVTGLQEGGYAYCDGPGSESWMGDLRETCSAMLEIGCAASAPWALQYNARLYKIEGENFCKAVLAGDPLAADMCRKHGGWWYA